MTLPRRDVAILAALFGLSGCAALIYEVAWLQALGLVVGSDAAAMAVVLCVFMGGMALGSGWLAPRLARRAPLRTYALLEASTGLAGAIIPWVLPAAAALYGRAGGTGIGGLVVRATLSGALLLPPTVALGATLPVAARWLRTRGASAARVGWLYGANTLGAVAGSLAAAFLLLRYADVRIASAAAAALNGVAALGGARLASRSGDDAPRDAPSAAEERGVPSRAVLAILGLSGATALTAEIVWTRNLALLLGATVYAFALILAAMLLGLALGSALGAAIARSRPSPVRCREALGAAQLLLVVALFWGTWALEASVFRWRLDPDFLDSAWRKVAGDLWRCLRITGPAAIAWGATFPLGVAALAHAPGDVSARAVGRAYATNTIGAVAAAALAGTTLVPLVGTLRAQQLCAVAAALGGWLAWRRPWTRERPALHAALALGLAAMGLVCAALMRPLPPDVVGYGPYAGMSAPRRDPGAFVYVGEGANASIAVSHWKDGTLAYHNAGKVQASNGPQDMRLQRMLGHLTTLLARDPKNVLTVGFGAGVTAGCVSLDPAVARETVVEIESLVPPVSDRFFGRENHHAYRSANVRVVIDDGRHYILTSDDTYDAITSDPFDPWARGAAALTTKELFEAMKRRLRPGGIVTLWVPLYETGEDVVRTEVATFVDVFPDAALFGNIDRGEGYDTVLVGAASTLVVDVDALEARLARPEYRAVRRSLQQSGFSSAMDLLSTFVADGAQLRAWTAGAPLNRDRDLRLQYLAGLAPRGTADPGAIYAHIAHAGAWPEGLFTGSHATVMQLHARYAQDRAGK